MRKVQDDADFADACIGPRWIMMSTIRRFSEKRVKRDLLVQQKREQLIEQSIWCMERSDDGIYADTTSEQIIRSK